MMILFSEYIPSQDPTTTFSKERTEYRVHSIPTSFDKDFYILSRVLSVDSTFTSINPEKARLLPDKITEPFQTFTDDFDLIIPFSFNSSKVIKAKIIRSEFNPAIVID